MTAQNSGIDKLRPPRSSGDHTAAGGCKEGRKEGHTEVLTEVKEKIALADCGISGLRFRRYQVH
ncbi:Chromosome 3B, genomic scaffold, cultivar Chinese Spring, partial [Operophtera brumata]